MCVSRLAMKDVLSQRVGILRVISNSSVERALLGQSLEVTSVTYTAHTCVTALVFDIINLHKLSVQTSPRLVRYH